MTSYLLLLGRGAFIAVIALFLLASCRSMVRSSIQENDKHIPIGFGNEDVTILAVKKDAAYNRWLKKSFAKNYSGKYIITDASELTSLKYQNTGTYRYVLDESEKNHPNLKTGIHDGMSPSTSFSLTDRSTGKIYKTRYVNGPANAVMREYLTKLETIRKRNAK